MLPPDVHVVGIQRIELDKARGEFILYFALSNGEIASVWWPVADMENFATITAGEPLVPRGASLQ